VWFDARPTTCRRSVRRSEQDYTDWWPVDYHLIGKDIIRHHCVYWPAMLMSAGVEPPKGYAVGGWLLVGGEKMAKSGGNAVNPLELTDLVGVDGFRYYVLAETPYGSDGDFTVEGLVARYHADLANNLGNPSRGDGCRQSATRRPRTCADSPLAEAASRRTPVCRAGTSSPSRALDAAWSLIRATNAFLESNEPWKSEPGAAVDAVMGDALEALRIVALLAFPAVPRTSQEIWERIGLKGNVADQRLPEAAEWGGYPGGVTVVAGDSLFPHHERCRPAGSTRIAMCTTPASAARRLPSPTLPRRESWG
jgi:methionyl-tRNA synthetase